MLVPGNGNRITSSIRPRTSLSGIDRFAYSVGFAATPLASAREVIACAATEETRPQMWAVLYDDGMSLTTASEHIARSLAEAERQRGHRVTVRRLDDAETHLRGASKSARPPEGVRGAGPVRPDPEPIRPAERFARPKPISEPEPLPAPEPEPP